MTKLLAALAMVMPLLCSQAFAANSQQNKMTACNKDATGKKGDERKAFMKECLSSKPAAAPTQQEKMKTCNADATGKKGDERKAFMKECLKKS
jgi:hypothetical protein